MHPVARSTDAAVAIDGPDLFTVIGRQTSVDAPRHPAIRPHANPDIDPNGSVKTWKDQTNYSAAMMCVPGTRHEGIKIMSVPAVTARAVRRGF